MLTLYIFIQMLCMILICIGSFKFPNMYLLELLKFFPILLNLIMCFNRKINIKLKLVLLFVVLADFMFLFSNSCVHGIALFVFVQIIYMDYLINIKHKEIYFIPFVNLIIVCILKQKIILIEAIIYGLLLLLNIMIVTKKIKKSNSKTLLKKSLLFLLICDVFIALK